MYERVWRKLKMCALKRVLRLDLATSKSPKWHTCEGNWRVTTAKALQDKMYSLARLLARDLNSRLVLIAGSSHQNTLFGWKLTFYIPHVPYYKYTYTHEIWRASRENFERETLEKNKIDSSTIFIVWFSKFLYSHPLPWHIHERYICQILISSDSFQWGGILVLGKQFRDNQFTWLMQWAYCRIWEAKEEARRNPVGAISL